MPVFVADLSNTSCPSWKLKGPGRLWVILTLPHKLIIWEQSSPPECRFGPIYTQAKGSGQHKTIHISNPITSVFLSHTILPFLLCSASTCPTHHWTDSGHQVSRKHSLCAAGQCSAGLASWTGLATLKRWSSCQHKGEAGSQGYRCTDSQRPSL